MTIQQFIETAIEGGYTYDQSIGWGNGNNPECFYHLVLDPKAWEAVGRVRGWMIESEVPVFEEEKGSLGWRRKLKPQWWINFARMPQELEKGKTLEEFLATL